MAVHRYWRARGIEAYAGEGLELSAFYLIVGGVRGDASATLTASIEPDVAGVLGNLQDGVASTSARWSAQSARKLELRWDFGGSPVKVQVFQLAGDSNARFPLILALEYSDDAILWVRDQTFSGIFYPSAGGLTTYTMSPLGGDVYFSNNVALLHMDGVNGESVFTDVMGKTVTPIGGAATTTDQSIFNTASLFLNGTSQSLAFPSSSDWNFGTGDFKLEVFIRPTSIAPARQNIFAGATGELVISLVGSAVQVGVFYVKGIATSPVSLVVANVWQKLQVTRESSTLKIILDEVVIASVTDSTNITFASGPRIGSSSYASDYAYYGGYVQEFRATKGVSRSSENLVEQTAALPNYPPSSVEAEVPLNLIRGRSAPNGSALVLQGSPPPLDYGNAYQKDSCYLSIESGSVKDQITGVLGEGIGRVKGTVATKGSPNQPVHRKVRLIRERDGLVVREAWSNATTGEYDFQWVDEAQTFTVVSYDHLHNYRAVIADNLTPELMP